MQTALAALAVLFVSTCLAAGAPQVPIRSGNYSFRWKDAEFPNSPGFPVTVKVRGNHVRVINEQRHATAPYGLLEEAVLMWHASAGKWILGQDEKDKLAPTVGGCGDSDPHVIDFETREIWTCEWGP